MEVHHHPHHHHSKSWKEYFFEFFMLFFAVFCGFLVENFREHHIENERAERLAQSLFADIKRDTSALNQCPVFTQEKIVNSDSLVTLLHQPREKWNDTLL